MSARTNLNVTRACWISMAIIAIGLIFGPALCFAQVLGRPASESYVISKINAHNSMNNAHEDIRALIQNAGGSITTDYVNSAIAPLATTQALNVVKSLIPTNYVVAVMSNGVYRFYLVTP